jgi:hypothetical protein
MWRAIACGSAPRARKAGQEGASQPCVYKIMPLHGFCTVVSRGPGQPLVRQLPRSKSPPPYC